MLNLAATDFAAGTTVLVGAILFAYSKNKRYLQPSTKISFLLILLIRHFKMYFKKGLTFSFDDVRVLRFFHALSGFDINFAFASNIVSSILTFQLPQQFCQDDFFSYQKVIKKANKPIIVHL